MNSFKAYCKKELIEGIRTYKFIILAIGILFFAVLDPVMLKLLPIIIKSQFETLDINTIADLSQRGVMASHLKNLYQISTLVICMSMMGIVSSEKNEKTLTLPVSIGCKTWGILLAKWVVYSLVLIIVTLMGVTFAYCYAGLLFDFNFGSLALALKAGALYGLFYSFLISVLIVTSTLFEKPFVAGVLTLLVAYGMTLLSGLLPWIGRYLPIQLLAEAKAFTTVPSTDLIISMIWTFGTIAILLYIAASKLSADELV